MQFLWQRAGTHHGPLSYIGPCRAQGGVCAPLTGAWSPRTSPAGYRISCLYKHLALCCDCFTGLQGRKSGCCFSVRDDRLSAPSQSWDQNQMGTLLHPCCCHRPQLNPDGVSYVQLEWLSGLHPARCGPGRLPSWQLKGLLNLWSPAPCRPSQDNWYKGRNHHTRSERTLAR